jgi:NADH-quinone oxidoreductase subunit F
MRIRIGLGSCGIAAGAAKIFDTIKDEIAARGLDVDLQQTGCIGMCHHEPLLDVIEDDGTVYTYGHVTPDHAARILDNHGNTNDNYNVQIHHLLQLMRLLNKSTSKLLL